MQDSPAISVRVRSRGFFCGVLAPLLTGQDVIHLTSTLAIVVFVLILPLLPLIAFIELNRRLSKPFAKILSAIFGEEEVISDEEQKRQDFHKRGDKILGYLIGAAGASTFLVYSLTNMDLKGIALAATLFAIPGMLLTAFRGGSEFTRVIAYAQHDLKLIHEKAESLPFGKIISKALTPPIIINTLFGVMSMVSIPQIKEQVSAEGLQDEGFGRFLPFIPLIMWLGGLVYGYVHAYLVMKGNPYFLMKDDMGIAIFMGILKIDKEVNKMKSLVLKLPKPPMPPRPKLPPKPSFSRKKK